MIKVYRGADQMGVALFDNKTGDFLYGEVCTKERLITFLGEFTDHDVVIYVDKEWMDHLTEIWYLIPHLQDIATVCPVDNLNVLSLLKEGGRAPRPKVTSLTYVLIGAIIGCLLLIPTSKEYKQSVLSQANSIEEFTVEFAKNQPKPTLMRELYTNIDALSKNVNVEAFSYKSGSYKIVFTSNNGMLTVNDLEGFEGSELEKVSSLEDADTSALHVYELEGGL